MKHPFIALSIVAVAAGAICAPFALSQTATFEPLAAETAATEHIVEITEFAYTSVVLDGNETSQFLPARLKNEGNYCMFEQVLFASSHFNANGNLFDATLNSPVKDSGEPRGKFYITIETSRVFYANRDDSTNGRPLAVRNFSALTKIELYPGEGNAVTLTDRPDSDKDKCDYYDGKQDGEEEHYVFTLAPDYIHESFGTYMTQYRFTFSNAKEGDRFVVKKIVLTYTC